MDIHRPDHIWMCQLIHRRFDITKRCVLLLLLVRPCKSLTYQLTGITLMMFFVYAAAFGGIQTAQEFLSRAEDLCEVDQSDDWDKIN